MRNFEEKKMSISVFGAARPNMFSVVMLFNFWEKFTQTNKKLCT